MALQNYIRKRNFAVTPEPRGKAAKRKGHQFVIQKHAARRLHYDLRLELDGVMKSWAVTRGPSLNPGEKRLAVHVEDHPIEYNKFEGNIPKGEYGGGAVMIWDRGQWIPEDDPHRGYAKGHLNFSLEGEKLHGAWHLVRMRPRKGEKSEPWLLIKVDDEAARDAKAPDILEEKAKSVVSGRTIDEIADNKPVKKKKAKPALTTWHTNRKPAARTTLPRANGNSRSKRKPGAAARSKSKKSSSKARSKKRGPDPAKIPAARPAKLPDFVAPALATLHTKAPSSADWVHEIKFDGYRIQARLDDDEVRLLTRKGLDWTVKFEPVADTVASLSASQALLDGEIIVEGEGGVSSFSSLQADLSAGRSDRFVYYVFDLLHLGGFDLTASPLIERKRALQALLPAAPGIVRFSEHFEEDGAVLLKHACELKLEGIISKRREGSYRSGRRDDWVKTKCSNRQEFIVAGYGPSTVLKRGVGSLVLAYNEDGRLRYAGRAGTGFTQKSSKQMWERLEPLRRDTVPFEKLPPEEKGRPVFWVEPRVVVEISFPGWTGDRLVRHGAFKGVREDKPPKDIEREVPSEMKGKKAPTKKVAAQGKTFAKRTPAKASPPKSKGKTKVEFSGIPLSNPNRVYWPEDGVTKENLAQFYSNAWDWIGPHLVGRPLNLVRCPDGIAGQCFFQKHASAGIDSTHLERIPDREHKDSLAIRDLEGLIALVQAGVLEIHVWGSKLPDIEKCDRIVFDLDPGPQVGWPQVIAAAREVRDRLAALKLESFLKTSGGKGLHIVLPLRGEDWDIAKDFAHRIALDMTTDSPQHFTANMAKSTRTGRIFVDYLRNGRGATSIAAYSTRARPGAAVSTPIRWEELGPQMTPDRFTLFNLPQRLAKLRRDPWAEIGRIKQSLPKKAKNKKPKK